MAFAGEREGQDSHIAFLQACSLYGNLCGGSSVQVSDPSQLGFFGYNNYCDNTVLEEGEGSDNSSGSTKNASSLSHLPSLLDPAATNANCTGFVFGTANSPPEDAQSVINFRTSYDNLECHEESLLSFEQGELVVSGNSNRMVDHEDDYSIWVDDVAHNIQWNQPTCLKVTNETRLSEDLNCFETASGYDLMSSDNQHRERPFGWLFPAPVATTGSIQESCSGPDEACLLKRPYTGGEMQAAAKKQCFDSDLKPKFKSSASKDPQSIAAKV
ncbi:PREDICTED: putative transcription factor bHLH086 [Nelumbo nucifera]|uniref:Transcription factor bHLH086 n=1 Tax=Nelumbo nucifera TaxID=4432 RepID=A0A1U7ZH82_NELNU|nr:PREDICTED: putative transcription factor bHLH086 [Nelumbo nucifera]